MVEIGLKPDGYHYRKACLVGLRSLPEAVVAADVAEIDGRVHAFMIGGPIRPGLGCLLVGHSTPDLQGVPYLMRVHHMARWPDLPRFNDGTDAGRPGLRELKQAFRPVAMNMLYRATIG